MLSGCPAASRCFRWGRCCSPSPICRCTSSSPATGRLVKDCLAGDGEFGVVLIERGQEVGGGDVRFGVGTVARIVQTAELPDGRWLVDAVGTERFRVTEWLPEDPYPLAMVEALDEDAGPLPTPRPRNGARRWNGCCARCWRCRWRWACRRRRPSAPSTRTRPSPPSKRRCCRRSGRWTPRRCSKRRAPLPGSRCSKRCCGDAREILRASHRRRLEPVTGRVGPPRRPRSAPRRSPSSTVEMARSGSFRPWPVRVQTTVSPVRIRPASTARNRPATEAAEAGSQNTPSRSARSR